MKKAFTLAEVLITLAIIGIIAAMTIPTLVSKYQKKQYVVQLQKIYSSLANAAKMVMADEQVDNLNSTYLYTDEYSEISAENSVGKFLKTYFKISKTCTFFKDNLNECIVEDYKDIYSGEKVDDIATLYCAVLSGGSVICLYPFTSGDPMLITVDVNGKAGPNIIGRDVFEIVMNYRGEISESFNKNESDIEIHNPENCNEDGDQLYGITFGCFNKIIQDGWKMDY